MLPCVSDVFESGIPNLLLELCRPSECMRMLIILIDGVCVRFLFSFKEEGTHVRCCGGETPLPPHPTDW